MTYNTRCHRGVFELDPDDGITPEAVTVFTRGQCHALGLTLHKLTGWELVGHAFRGTDVPDHVFVRAPDGRTLDIEGWDVESRWSFDDTAPVCPDAARNAFNADEGGSGYLDPDLTVAQPFARLVLTQYVPELVF